jgi:hypothetical protein
VVKKKSEMSRRMMMIALALFLSMRIVLMTMMKLSVVDALLVLVRTIRQARLQ